MLKLFYLYLLLIFFFPLYAQDEEEGIVWEKSEPIGQAHSNLENEDIVWEESGCIGQTPPVAYLTVAEAADIAISNNKQLEQAMLQAQRDYWIYRETLGRYLPSAAFTQIWSRTNELPDVSFSLGKFVDTQRQIIRLDQLILSLPVFYEIGSNDWLQAASFFASMEELVQTLAKIRIAHFRILTSRKLLAVQQEVLDLYKTSFEDEEIKLSVGESTDFEYTRNRLAYTNALSEYYRIASSIEIARDDWVKLLGLDPDQALHYDIAETEIPLEEIAFIDELIERTEGAPTQVKKPLFTCAELEFWNRIAAFYRPSIHRFHAELQSADMRVRGTWSSYLPEIRAFHTYNYNAPSQFFSTKRSFQETGIELSWPIFDGFSRESRLMRFKKEKKIAHSVEEENEYFVQLQVRDNSQALQEAFYSVRAALEARDLAAKGIAMGKVLFELGDITALDYRDMIQSLGRANFDLAQSRFNLIASYYELIASMGLQDPEAGVCLLNPECEHE